MVLRDRFFQETDSKRHIDRPAAPFEQDTAIAVLRQRGAVTLGQGFQALADKDIVAPRPGLFDLRHFRGGVGGLLGRGRGGLLGKHGRRGQGKRRSKQGQSGKCHVGIYR